MVVLHTRKGGVQGIYNSRRNDINGSFVGVALVVDSDKRILNTDGGKVLLCPVHSISAMGRATQGVRVMNLGAGERLASMARVAERDEDEAPLEGEEPSDPGASKGNGAAAGSGGGVRNESEAEEGN